MAVDPPRTQGRCAGGSSKCMKDRSLQELHCCQPWQSNARRGACFLAPSSGWAVIAEPKYDAPAILRVLMVSLGWMELPVRQTTKSSTSHLWTHLPRNPSRQAMISMSRDHGDSTGARCSPAGFDFQEAFRRLHLEALVCRCFVRHDGRRERYSLMDTTALQTVPS